MLTQVRAGANFSVDYTHGHPSEWLDQFKAKRESDPKKEHLYVHLLTHTHDDVGWLKTFDDYYSGTN